jgi:hypothetical protein
MHDIADGHAHSLGTHALLRTVGRRDGYPHEVTLHDTKRRMQVCVEKEIVSLTPKHLESFSLPQQIYGYKG